MAKKRVHEIAKQRGMPSKEVIAILQKAGLDVKTAAQSIDENDIAMAFSNGQSAESREQRAETRPAQPAPQAQQPSEPRAQQHGGAPQQPQQQQRAERPSRPTRAVPPGRDGGP